MKIVYKITIPAFFLFAILIVFISFFSRKIVEDALLKEEFVRTVKTSESALHHEEYAEIATESEVDIHNESISHNESNEIPHTEEFSLLNPDNFKEPFTRASQLLFKQYIFEFKDPSIINIIVYGEDYRVLASTDSHLVGETLYKSGVESIFTGKESFYLKNTDNVGGDYIDIFAPLQIEGKTYGAIEIQLKTNTILLPVKDQLNNIVFVFILAGLVSFLGIYFVTNLFIISPLYYLQRKADEIASGNLENEIKIKSKDELGRLGVFFENMRQKLRISVDNLMEFNKQLEIKVEERTKELHSEQARLISSIESLPLGFIITDLNKNILMSNEGVKKIFSVRNKSISFDELKTFLSSSHDLEGNYIKCIQSKKPIINSVDYGKKILKVAYFPVIEKEVIGSVILFEDITDEQLLNRNKEEFFAVASHELRTPLTAIRDNSALLRDFFGKPANKKDSLEMIDDIYNSSTGLLKLVNDILNISLLEQNKNIFEKSDFDLSILIKEVVNELGAHAKQKSDEIIIEPHEKLPKVFSDERRIKEVLYNLIGNAINFTKNGTIKIRIVKENEYLKCFITDTGSGILPLNQSLLFKKFQQAGKNVITRDVSRGTGLGLYISRLLVEGLGGEIKLEESVINKGSTFSFTVSTSRD